MPEPKHTPELPSAVVEAERAYIEAWRVYDEAGRALVEAWHAYDKAKGGAA